MRKQLSALNLIWNRRSIGRLGSPGPSKEDLETIITAGAAAPDHGRLKPWRFVVFEGEARSKFGEILVQALMNRMEENGVSANERQIEKERNKLLRAPTVIAVLAEIDHESPIPAIEQLASAAAACQNMLLAATALGIGSMWRTGDQAYDVSVKAALGIKESDMIAGWLYFGTAPKDKGPRDELEDLGQYITHWN